MNDPGYWSASRRNSRTSFESPAIVAIIFLIRPLTSSSEGGGLLAGSFTSMRARTGVVATVSSIHATDDGANEAGAETRQDQEISGHLDGSRNIEPPGKPPKRKTGGEGKQHSRKPNESNRGDCENERGRANGAGRTAGQTGPPMINLSPSGKPGYSHAGATATISLRGGTSPAHEKEVQRRTTHGRTPRTPFSMH